MSYNIAYAFPLYLCMRIQHLLLLSIIVLYSSCTIYSPGALPVPLHSRAGVVNVSGAYSAVENGLSVQGSVALTDYLSIGTSWSGTQFQHKDLPGFYYKERNVNYQHYDFMMGYKLHESDKKLYECIAGVGRGDGMDRRWIYDSTRTYTADTIYRSNHYFRYFTQLNLAFGDERIRVIFSPRITLNQLTEATQNNISYNDLNYFIVCAEPAFTIRHKLFSFVDVLWQVTWYYPINSALDLSKQPVYYNENENSPFFFHAGIMANLNVWNRKNKQN